MKPILQPNCDQDEAHRMVSSNATGERTAISPYRIGLPAEGVGFEPTRPKKSPTVFKTVSLDHSDTPPGAVTFSRVSPNPP